MLKCCISRVFFSSSSIVHLAWEPGFIISTILFVAAGTCTKKCCWHLPTENHFRAWGTFHETVPRFGHPSLPCLTVWRGKELFFFFFSHPSDKVKSVNLEWKNGTRIKEEERKFTSWLAVSTRVSGGRSGCFVWFFHQTWALDRVRLPQNVELELPIHPN